MLIDYYIICNYHSNGRAAINDKGTEAAGRPFFGSRRYTSPDRLINQSRLSMLFFKEPMNSATGTPSSTR